MLSGGRRRSRERRRTLEATLDWSYNLLDDDEKEFFVRLGVFVGDFDAEAAASVASVGFHDALDILESLVAKSLVTISRTTDATYFRLLETVRAYTEERLDRDDLLSETRDLHVEHYVTALRQTETVNLYQLIGPHLRRWQHLPHLPFAIGKVSVSLYGGHTRKCPCSLWLNAKCIL